MGCLSGQTTSEPGIVVTDAGKEGGNILLVVCAIRCLVTRDPDPGHRPRLELGRWSLAAVSGIDP